MRPPARTIGVVAVAMILAACGDSPLESIGIRSSEWMNEPQVVFTTPVPVTTPLVTSSSSLRWSNDDIVNEHLDDPDALIAEVFSRREGDRFIQASREEIAAALTDLVFPATVPYGARWVSSQLVVENTGELAEEPTAAFGIWSAEPYSRSRSVAQMVVLRVATDVEAATEVSDPATEVSCARFSNRSTEQCEIISIADRDTWKLGSSAGITLIWFDGVYRYELFGRSFVPREALEQMAAELVPFAALAPAGT